MQEVWLNIDKFDKDIIIYALERGINNFLVKDESIKIKIEKLGRVKTHVLNDDILIYKYQNKDDEDKIVNLSKKQKIILKSESWEIIPWENLIAKKAKFFVYVNNIEELKKAIGVLEKGVYGIILNVNDIKKLGEILVFFKSLNSRIKLVPATITNIKILTSGERVCVDTSNIMDIGEGMLVGSSSNFLFLVHSESLENPYCDPRPFRVNAGGVYAYIKTSLDKTKYLSELQSGDEVLIVKFNGETKKGIVGRVKIETRPLILIEASINKERFSIILQNAETINLTTPEGKPISVTSLRIGDKVLTYVDKGARHFGIKIEENIIEK